MTALIIRDFGATGRGLENDSVAFRRAAAEFNDAGGGALLIPQGELDLQDLAGACGLGYAWRPQPILQFVGCSSPVVIEGEGEHETVLMRRLGFGSARLSRAGPASGRLLRGACIFGFGSPTRTLRPRSSAATSRISASRTSPPRPWWRCPGNNLLFDRHRSQKEPHWYMDLGAIVDT
jgi:hypothetical protein